MGTGIVVGGIILLIIGIGAYSYLGSLKTQAEQGVAECQSILGQAGQFISPEVSQKCQQAQQFTPAIQAGYYLGIALAIIGFIITIGGGIGIALRAARRGAESTKPHESNVQESSSERNDQIFCRSCGKKRQISGEYCPFCGRSSRFLSTTMKRCINCDSLTGEDSLFCANCGHQDFRQAVDHIPKTAPEKDIDKSIRHSIDNSGDVVAISPLKNRFKFLASNRFLIVIAGIAIAVVIIVLIYQSMIVTTSPSGQ
jgi:RNA polymerase subunit RPABC4/transcription elongation factor Spt4